MWVRVGFPLIAVLAAAGCPENTGPTYHTDIAPLLQRECMSCHQEGGIGPFELTTYDQAKAQKDLMAFSVAARRMPPGILDNSGDCQHFPDARWLSEEDIALFAAWAEADAPEGQAPAEAIRPLPLAGISGDGIIDVIMDEPYTPEGSPNEPNDDYRCFILDPERTVDSWLTGYEIVPGEPAEVHHMLLFSMLDADADAAAQALDDADPRPGFQCFGDSGVDDTNLLAVWAPGRDAVTYPEGTGLFVPAGRKLVMQLHYNLLSGALPDQTALRLRFANEVQKDALLVPIADDDLTLEGGLPKAEYSFTVPLLGLPEPLEIHGAFPHMHTLGRTLTFSRQAIADQQGEQRECLAHVPNWNFHWQEVAFYDAPIIVDGSERLDVSCTFDTSSRSEDILWGEGTEDEMCLVFVYLTRENGLPVAEVID
jgi:hypothetical protein